MKKNNIILVGFMGSGKTTIARCLSKDLQLKWIDTDKMIETSSGKKISELFKHSEAYFRSWETTICKSITRYNNTIISTGGGIVTNEKSRDILKKTGWIIHLDISSKTILTRLKDDKKRPLLQTENRLETIEKLLKERTPIYQKIADKIINVDKLSMQETISTLKEFIGEKTNANN